MSDRKVNRPALSKRYEAAVLPQGAGASSLPQQFKIAQRITLHMRYRAKYFEVRMPDERAFVSTCNGQPVGAQASTLKEFVTIQDWLPTAVIEAHAQRGDFSRWVAEVFGDHLLAEEIREVEKQFRSGQVVNLSELLIKRICERYKLTS